MGGVEFQILRGGERTIIKVLCPKCGEWGFLRKNGRRGYTIVHRSNYNGARNRWCRISWTHRVYDDVDKIYKEFKGNNDCDGDGKVWIKKLVGGRCLYIPAKILDKWKRPEKVVVELKEDGEVVVKPLR